MTAAPSAFDALVLPAPRRATPEPETAGDLAVLMVEAEGLRRENADLRAERNRWRRIAMDQADRLAAYARADVARDRVARVKAWGDGGGS